jgi:acyl transferase domain-containing protein/acyl carrier protein/SAM-dependent methyltransferase
MTVKSTGVEGRYHSSIHGEALVKIFDFCDSRHDLEFPPAERLIVPLRSNATAQILTEGCLHEHAIRCIMTELANWHLTISAAVSQLIRVKRPVAAAFGLLDFIPSSLVRESGLRIIKMRSSKLFPCRLAHSDPALPSGTVTPEVSAPQNGRYPDHAIAVVGMACKFPGADSIEEFWELLTSGTSMVEEMPEERFPTKGLRRSQEGKLKFWGNFVRDVDAFDHRFFKKSSREAATMDPQQRLLLQVAYEAIESSGYFGKFSASVPDDIGCYLGVCANDYNDNVASHPPNAFSSLGTLRAFLSGKISHYFGWTGPSVTYDTACSSSAVAIHSACKAIEAGECSQALAGGVSLYTNPTFYQNLAAASFLSPTGPTKPFDARADGYCRGEGVGLVVLKKLTTALADGDNVLGVIAGSAVNQNSNSTYITVPHSPSQTSLYRKVSALSGIDPGNVSFVEAHGTGTPVGDPIEFSSIREVFAGPHRTKTLHVASVKGNIGHLEGASGVAALIKTLLMMQYKTIPIQANFTSLNPKIPALEPDGMEIPMSNCNWDTDFQVACINNYGAAGSNAAMIVCQPPHVPSYSHGRDYKTPTRSRMPIFISAHSEESLKAYCVALQKMILSSAAPKHVLSSLAFNLADKQNRSLSYVVSTTVADLAELNSRLTAVSSGTLRPEVNAKAKPVVLCFGGQVSNAVGLSKEVYDASTLLRSHLEDCDVALRSMGLNGLYPEIFQTSPVEDTVKLHCILFSLQYSCAKSWMDSGLHVDAVVGHSFGQLTALCVSGTLSLGDALKLVSGRASLMQRHWGPERGSMISIEADLKTVLNYVSSAHTSDVTQDIEFACYNGPTSHVLVGTRSAIDRLAKDLSRASIKHKRLNVTHGFHSVFTEPLLPGLHSLAQELTYNKPAIALQTCTKDRSCDEIGPRQITDHIRLPVYFGRAIERLAQSLGPSTWLEAGSSSSVTAMARRALDPSTASSHTFQLIQLGAADALGSLADATVNLWKSGHKVQFWPYHRSQKHEYPGINLPPYQFEKSRHWLSWVDTAQVPTPVEPSKPLIETERVLLSLTGFRDQNQRDATFSVDPHSKEYGFYVQGHAVLAEPLCPAPLYIELVTRAAMILMAESGCPGYLPCVENLEISAPLGMDVDRAINIDLTRTEGNVPAWTFKLTSKAHGDAKGNSSIHATGGVNLSLESPRLLTDFSRYERLVGYQKFTDLKNDPESEIMQGSTVYKAFSRVVQYADHYKGVRSVYGKGQQVAGIVLLPDCDQSSLHNNVTKPLAIDNFVQVAGLHVNCLNECRDNEVFVCTKVERIQPGLKFKESNSWVVYSSFTPIGEREVVNDIFVFDKESKRLVLMVLGAHFIKVLITSLTKVLSRANTARPRLESGTVGPTVSSTATIPTQSSPNKDSVLLTVTSRIKANAKPISRDDGTSKLDTDIRQLLHRVTDVPMEDFKDDSTLEELGIDSLMITEVMSEVCKFFELDISAADFATLLDIKSLRTYLLARGRGSHDRALMSDSSSESGEDSPGVTPARTAATSVEDVSSLPNDLESALAKLVAGHLETSMTLTRETNLGNEGLDSLLSIELASDIQKNFGATVDMSLLDGDSTFGDLLDMVSSQSQPSMSLVKARNVSTMLAPTTLTSLSANVALAPLNEGPAALSHAQQAFEDIRFDYPVFTKQTGFANFWKRVYPTQARLVLAYTVEAFAMLGCRLASLNAGQRLPRVQFLPKHHLLMNQLHEVLKDSSLVKSDGANWVRSDTAVDQTHSSTIFQEILQAFPHHASEHKLLNITGSKLAECLTGSADPLQLLFRSKENKKLLEDVYTNGPMYEAITKLLGSFLQKAYTTNHEGGTFHILELGGGTGGTTKYIVDFLARQGISFTYTFTDLSGSLVTAAKKKFSGKALMEFMIIDIEKPPPEKFMNKFHTIISTNCIHATRNLQVSATHIRQMLRPDGFVSLVEFTRNIFWFDLVFGLLEGWWLYEDGRKHVLASEKFWDSSMRAAGFKHVTWTDGSSEESRTLRIINGFPAEPASESFMPKRLSRKPEIETVVYKQAGRTTLYADVYLPSNIKPGEKRPIGILPHPNLDEIKLICSKRCSSTAVATSCSRARKSTSNKSHSLLPTAFSPSAVTTASVLNST